MAQPTDEDKTKRTTIETNHEEEHVKVVKKKKTKKSKKHTEEHAYPRTEAEDLNEGLEASQDSRKRVTSNNVESTKGKTRDRNNEDSNIQFSLDEKLQKIQDSLQEQMHSMQEMFIEKL